MPYPVVDCDGILDDGVEILGAGVSDLGVAIPQLPAFSVDGDAVVIVPGGFLMG